MSTSDSSAQEAVVVSGENSRGQHHAEVLIMKRDSEGPGGSGNYFNSLGVVDDVPDDEFDARFRALDPEKLRQEYGGDAVRFNGPRRFLGDRFTGDAFDGGKLSMLGDIPMYLYGLFVVPDFDAFVSGKQTPYHETVSKRTTTWFFDAGSEVYELESPEGTVFVMQSASLRVDPENTVDKLPTLGERLTLPEGWQFRARTLTEDLVMEARYDSDPPNTIVLDELENNYQRLRNAQVLGTQKREIGSTRMSDNPGQSTGGAPESRRTDWRVEYAYTDPRGQPMVPAGPMAAAAAGTVRPSPEWMSPVLPASHEAVM